MERQERSLVLMFRAGGESAAVRAADVQKVTPVGHVSRLPRLPAMVAGITQHRGRVVTVVDAAQLLFRQGSVGHDLGAARLLILERPARHIALWVDAVDEIESIRVGGEVLGERSAERPCLRVVQHRGRALQLVDVERVMPALEGFG